VNRGETDGQHGSPTKQPGVNRGETDGQHGSPTKQPGVNRGETWATRIPNQTTRSESRCL
jgi:hypothetical protein